MAADHKGPDIGAMMYAMRGSRGDDSHPGSGSHLAHSEGGGMNHHGGINAVFSHGGEGKDLLQSMAERNQQYEGIFKGFGIDKTLQQVLKGMTLQNFINTKIHAPAAHLNVSKGPNILMPSKSAGGGGGGGH